MPGGSAVRPPRRSPLSRLLLAPRLARHRARRKTPPPPPPGRRHHPHPRSRAWRFRHPPEPPLQSPPEPLQSPTPVPGPADGVDAQSLEQPRGIGVGAKTRMHNIEDNTGGGDCSAPARASVGVTGEQPRHAMACSRMRRHLPMLLRFPSTTVVVPMRCSSRRWRGPLRRRALGGGGLGLIGASEP